MPAPAPTRGFARVARGSAAGALCASVSMCGHLAAGGGRPAVGVVAVFALLLTGFLIVLADRRRGPGTILGLVAGSQLALHELLQLLGSHGGHSGHPGAGVDAPLMTLAHGVATLVAAAVLAGAENAVFTLVRLWSRTVRRVLPRPVLAPSPRRVPRPVRPLPAVARQLWGRSVPARRGPPVAVI